MDQGFKLNLTEGGAFLTITPDASVSIVDVISELKEKGISDYDGEAVKRALQEKRGTPIRVSISEAQNATEAREADFRIKISEDALTCEMWYIPEEGSAPHPTIERAKGCMNERNVVYGHDENAIRKMLEGPIHRKWVVTAKGDAPQNGKDAQINYKVDLNILKPRAVGDKVDMKELGTVINVIQGQEIAEKIPAIPGVDGMSLMGKKIPAYIGKDKNLPTGKGTIVSDDRCHLYAEVDGNLYIKDGKLVVNTVFEVKGDVDYGVGNIDFIGPVTILGSIREGFEVHSGSDMVVEGVVEGATISSKGSTTIKIGIRGTGKAKITSKGNVNAGYIDQAFVRSDGDINVAEAIWHSDIGARGVIMAMGNKKGQIVGGRVQAGNEVVCEVLGSEMGTKTEVTVGELAEYAEERKRSEENIKQFEDQRERIDANIKFLKGLQDKGLLTPDKQEVLAKITKAKFQLRAQYDSTKKRLDELDRDKERSKLDGCVRVKNICYSGVTVNVRGIRYLVRENLKYVRFLCEDGEVKVRSFD
ncbi:MAG: FapA family protein [Synergistaceae bacterium]|jgi:uncharacterized protein (DUF342 family)|nr:FapA family protein [Synergistaceae bacterium]